MTNNGKTCTETVYDPDCPGEVLRSECGAPLSDGCKYGMCPSCYKFALKWAYIELYDARMNLHKAEQKVISLGGRINGLKNEATG